MVRGPLLLHSTDLAKVANAGIVRSFEGPVSQAGDEGRNNEEEDYGRQNKQNDFPGCSHTLAMLI
jgi:hypothetical protein